MAKKKDASDKAQFSQVIIWREDEYEIKVSRSTEGDWTISQGDDVPAVIYITDDAAMFAFVEGCKNLLES